MEKANNGTYTKSFNLIAGKYYSTYYLGDNKKRTSGWTSELQNIYAEDWNQDLSLISEGSAMKDGTCFPSVSHTNVRKYRFGLF